MKYWGGLGALWGGIFGLLFGVAFSWMPGIGLVLVAVLENAIFVGGLTR
ncbi:MAG TPA: hypothetical protein VK673_16650 [Chthoniobacterales bacterium]|nr:hypothetical protein [Chthoniobacterales bacterium]